MKSIFAVIRAYVLADAAIAAVIGTRFYPIKAPQGATYPLVTMQKILAPRFPHLRGPSHLAKPTYQIDAWVREPGTAFTQALELSELIRRRIDGFSGVLTDASESPAAAYQISILYDDSRDLFEPEQSGGGYYRQSTDYVIWHSPITA